MGIEGGPQKHTKQETPAEKAIKEMHRTLDAAPDIDRFNPDTASIERFKKELSRLDAQIEDSKDHSPDDIPGLHTRREEVETDFRKRFNREP